MTSRQLELCRDLARTIEELPDLQDGASSAGSPRDDVLLYLRGKVLPELGCFAELPIFVGVQGGTNVGKSTVFNALASKLLSPAVVQASATKHPLVFAHERWRHGLLSGAAFPDLTCRELSDPKELIIDADRPELLYFRFHADDALSSVALVDSPDFDGALPNNLRVARRVSVLSDITLFVTTAQKYFDRELVAYLEALRDLKADVILVFNMVSEEIVFETLVDDLRHRLGPNAMELRALRLPSSAVNHPEDEIRGLLRSAVLDRLGTIDPGRVKVKLIERTLDRVLALVDDLVARYSPEIRLKQRLLRHLETRVEEEVAAYAENFKLALPEETLAVRRLVRLTEIGPSLELSGDLRHSSKGLGVVALGLRSLNDTLRRVLLRLSASDEGAIDGNEESIREYARARDDADFEQVLRRAEGLRVSVENFCRGHEEVSPLAREVLHGYFTPQRATEHPERVGEAFSDTGKEVHESGEALLERQQTWLRDHPLFRRGLFLTANALKISLGLVIAYVLPPQGILSVWNWLYFVLGYLLAAYIVALLISIATRWKPRFRRARISHFRRVLERSMVEPLSAFLDTLLQDDALRRVERAALAVREEKR